MPKLLRRIIGIVWGIYCPICGEEEITYGWYDEKSYCPKHNNFNYEKITEEGQRKRSAINRAKEKGGGFMRRLQEGIGISIRIDRY